MPRPTRPRCNTARPATGSATHITCVMLNLAIGVKVTHVPYRGTGPAMQDLIGGRIDYICDVIIDQPRRCVRAESGQGARAALAGTQPGNARAADRRTSRARRISTATAGTRSSFPRARPSRSCAGSARRPARSSTCRRCASGSKASVSTCRRRDRRTPEYLQSLVLSELEKWAAPVKASGAAEE